MYFRTVVNLRMYSVGVSVVHRQKPHKHLRQEDSTWAIHVTTDLLPVVPVSIRTVTVDMSLSASALKHSCKINQAKAEKL